MIDRKWEAPALPPYPQNDPTSDMRPERIRLAFNDPQRPWLNQLLSPELRDDMVTLETAALAPGVFDTGEPTLPVRWPVRRRRLAGRIGSLGLEGQSYRSIGRRGGRIGSAPNAGWPGTAENDATIYDEQGEQL